VTDGRTEEGRTAYRQKWYINIGVSVLESTQSDQHECVVGICICMLMSAVIIGLLVITFIVDHCGLHFPTAVYFPLHAGHLRSVEESIKTK